MRATEFCYWLQGAFELGIVTTWRAREISCIQKHLAMVAATGQDQKQPRANGFCQWLMGAIDMVTAAPEEADKIPPAHWEQVNKIRDRLASIFEHEIDKGYPNGNQLNAIHNGGQDEFGPVYRC